MEANPIDIKFPGVFRTWGQYPTQGTITLIQFTRYIQGNLVTSDSNDIESITPYAKRQGGRILYKNGARDIYYKIWPLTILMRP